MVGTELQRARELIENNQYVEAWRILVMLENPTADRWLSELDDVMSEPGKNEDFLEEPPIELRDKILVGFLFLVAFTICGFIFLVGYFGEWEEYAGDPPQEQTRQAIIVTQTDEAGQP
jgi:hypothetical protein